MMEVLWTVKFCLFIDLSGYLQLEGGTAEEDGPSSSGSRDLLLPRPTGRLGRLAACGFGRSGELCRRSVMRRRMVLEN